MRGTDCLRRVATRLGKFMRALGSLFGGAFSCCWKPKGSNGQEGVDVEATVDAFEEFQFTMSEKDSESDSKESSVCYKALQSMFPYCVKKVNVGKNGGRITVQEFLKEDQDNNAVLNQSASSIDKITQF